MTPDAPNAPEEPEFLDSEPPRPPGRSHFRLSSLRSISDRTPLRTKLITAVLALVILALVAISASSVLILRPLLYDQRDSDLQRELARVPAQLQGNQITLGQAYGTTGGFVYAVQQRGKQLAGSLSQPSFDNAAARRA